MADLKKLFIYVKAQEGTDPAALKNQVVAASANSLNDRVFFLADTDEIVVHGHKFGVSKEVKDQLDNLEANTKAFTLALSGSTFPAAEIVDDVKNSTIAAYVAKKMATVSAANDSVVTVTPSTKDSHTDYAVDVVVDGKTILNKDGKLASGLKFKYTSAAENTGDKGHKDGHPYLALTDTDGTVIEGCEFDVNEFVVDGMLGDVAYNPATGVITFTWNTDAGNKVTTLDASQLFKIEGIHTATADYLTVTQENPNEHPDLDGDKDGLKNTMAYHIDAKVNKIDLTVATSVTHTEEDAAHSTPESYAVTVTKDAKVNNFAEITNSLADAKIVAAKFKATDELIAAVANRAIERDKTLTDGINAKIQKLTDDLAQEVQDRTDGDADLQTKIDEINSESEDLTAHPTSVAAKIAALRDSLKVKLTATDANNLVGVSLNQEAGKIKDLAITAKVDSLMSDTKLAGIDGQVSVGDKTYYMKDIKAISANDPALVTTQDAWLYGKALMTTIKSDSNDYIKIANVDGDIQIQFEPWAEVHSIDELKKQSGYTEPEVKP